VTTPPYQAQAPTDPGPSRRKPIRRFLMTRVLPPIATWAYRRRARTWRYVIDNEQVLVDLLRTGQPIVAGFLHARSLPLLQYFSEPGRGRWLFMSSQSRDGELMSRIAEGLGFKVARGSSGRGGFRALIDMIKVLRDDPGLNSGLTIDGSRGPRGVAQVGVIILAQQSRSAILPLAASTRDGLIWKRAWDRQVIPRRGAEIHLRFCEPIQVPARIDAAQTEALRLELERRLIDATVALDARTGFSDTEPLQKAPQ
jgi:lysophospholipid acyltransferase (LPLAT)-like uncharacterized protein